MLNHLVILGQENYDRTLMNCALVCADSIVFVLILNLIMRIDGCCCARWIDKAHVFTGSRKGSLTNYVMIVIGNKNSRLTVKTVDW